MNICFPTHSTVVTIQINLLRHKTPHVLIFFFFFLSFFFFLGGGGGGVKTGYDEIWCKNVITVCSTQMLTT